MYVLNVYLELFEKSLIFTRGESLPRREKSEKSGVLMLLTKFDRWGGGGQMETNFLPCVLDPSRI